MKAVFCVAPCSLVVYGRFRGSKQQPSSCYFRVPAFSRYCSTTDNHPIVSRRRSVEVNFQENLDFGFGLNWVITFTHRPPLSLASICWDGGILIIRYIGVQPVGKCYHSIGCLFSVNGDSRMHKCINTSS
jgi:hypothetical protein